MTEDALSVLREKVKEYLTEKRYSHTLGVEKEAARLGKMYLPGKINELRASALLHDITKRWNDEKQLQYCRDFGIMIGEHEKAQTKTLHAKTAAELVLHDFPEYASPDVVSGVRYHTTGHDGMTLFESIIYLADYIEETRTFPECVMLREYYNSRLSEAEDRSGRETALIMTMIRSFDMTVNTLLEGSEYIDTDTVRARNYFLALKDGHGDYFGE